MAKRTGRTNPHRTYRSNYRISKYAQAALTGILANPNINADRLLDNVARFGDELARTAWAIAEAMNNNRPTREQEEAEEKAVSEFLDSEMENVN